MYIGHVLEKRSIPMDPFDTMAVPLLVAFFHNPLTGNVQAQAQ